MQAGAGRERRRPNKFLVKFCAYRLQKSVLRILSIVQTAHCEVGADFQSIAFADFDLKP